MDTVIEMLESESELLKLLGDNGDELERGLTSKEIARIMGWGEKKTLKRLNELIALGKIQCVMEHRKYITGIYNLKPVYIKV